MLDVAVQMANLSRRCACSKHYVGVHYWFSGRRRGVQTRGVSTRKAGSVSGRVSDKTPWTLKTLLALPQERQITRAA
jgi:hypothetical protein